MKKNLYRVAALLMAGAMIGSLAACGGKDTASNDSTGDSGSAQKEESSSDLEDVDTLYVGTYGGSWQEYFEYVAEQFTEKYGVDVVFDSSYDHTKRVAEGANPSVDVCLEDDIYMAQSDATEWYQTLDMSKIPNSSELYDEAFDPSGVGLVLNWGRFGICYRTDLVETAPTSWADLWNDEYAGKIAIFDIPNTGGAQFFIQANTMNGGTYEDATQGWDAFKKLAPNVKSVVTSSSDLMNLLTTGEVAVAPFWDGRVKSLQNDGVPVEFVTPEEGAYATITGMTIPTNAAAPNLAYEFMNMCFDSENQTKMTELTGYGPVNKNTVLDDETAANVVYGADQVKSLIFADWKSLEKVDEEWIETFQKEITPLIGK